MKATGAKILLVDDEPDILEIVGYNLKNEGYQVFTASSGKEGVAIAKEVKPARKAKPKARRTVKKTKSSEG